jgi:hypothetical protein
LLERLKVPAVLAALGIVAAGNAAAQTPPGISLETSLNRYYDASNAVTAGEIFGVPMPISHGDSGAWKLTLAPAYIASSADPLKVQGFSLDMAYSRLYTEGWGLYLVALGNYAKTEQTSDSGTPNSRMLNFSAPTVMDLMYAGTQASGGTIVTLAESAGVSYNLHWYEPDRVPVTLFATAVMTQSYARFLNFGYNFNGLNSGTPWTLAGVSQNSMNAYFAGGVIGASVEYKLGKHFLLRPHIFEVFLPYSKQTGTSAFQYSETCGGTPCYSNAGTNNFNSSLGVVYFPVPGVDFVWTDWSIGVNLIELASAPLLKAESNEFLHGATVTSIRVSYSFGTKEIQLHPPQFPEKTTP